MRVYVPGPLRSYTRGKPLVEASGDSLSELLNDLDARYPGIRFRMIDEQDGIRRHIKLFVDRKETDDLGRLLSGQEEIHIVCALSGG